MQDRPTDSHFTLSRSNLHLARPRFDIDDSELGVAVTVAQDSLDVGEVEVGPWRSISCYRVCQRHRYTREDNEEEEG